MGVTADQQLLREIMIREIETIHRYQDMLERAGSDDLQRFLAHAIYEEKEHVAEALQILRALDPMQDAALNEDHSAHFRPGGPGERALQAILRNGPPASAGGGPSANPPAAAPAPQRSANERSANATPFGRMAPGDDLARPTIGSLRRRA